MSAQLIVNVSVYFHASKSAPLPILVPSKIREAFLKKIISYLQCNQTTCMRHKIFSIVLVISTLCGYSQTNPFQKRFAFIDQYVDSIMNIWNIPGLAIGV